MADIPIPAPPPLSLDDMAVGNSLLGIGPSPSGGGPSLGQGLTGGLDLLNAFIGLNGSQTQANADVQQGAFQAKQLGLNAQYADIQAQEAETKGTFEQQEELIKTAGIEGSQSAGYAAQGVNSNFGTTRKVQDETSSFGAEDALTLSHNANMEAWGYKVKAENDLTQAKEDELASKNKASSTMLGGIAGFATGALKTAEALI